jgi:predicted acyl esterase
MMLSADILRGRYREDYAVAKPIESGKVLEYSIPLPHVCHTFQPGHRVMVQVQSSWFPLYDRNPQTFVPNIMYAPPESYVKATQRVWRTTEYPTAIEMPVLKSN